MQYILEDLDYIFIRALNAQGRWENLSLNELTDEQFVEWVTEHFHIIKIKDDEDTKGTPWTKQQKIDLLNHMVEKNNGEPVVVMIKRDKRKEFNQHG